MDIAKLGQIAGIAGVAIGAVVILLRPLVKRLSVGAVSARDRARIVIMIAVSALPSGPRHLLTKSCPPRSTPFRAP